MVIEALGAPSSGALSFLLGCVEDSLTREPKAWAIIEAQDGQTLYAPAFSKTLRHKMSQGRLLWVRVPEKDIPDVFLKILQSALFSGVFLRAFEGSALGNRFWIWLRRWQLASEKSGTHWLWQHRKACPRLGVSLSLHWQDKNRFEILRGHSLLEKSEWPSIQKLRHRPTSTESRPISKERDLCLIAN
jgi:hypothetical protein